MVENYNSMDLAAFKNVWVFCEQRQGKMMPTTFELISEGRKLADELGVNLCRRHYEDHHQQPAATARTRSSSASILCSRTTRPTRMPRSSATSSPR